MISYIFKSSTTFLTVLLCTVRVAPGPLASPPTPNASMNRSWHPEKSLNFLVTFFSDPKPFPRKLK